MVDTLNDPKKNMPFNIHPQPTGLVVADAVTGGLWVLRHFCVFFLSIFSMYIYMGWGRDGWGGVGWGVY